MRDSALTCPHCQHQLSGGDSLAGLNVSCPNCSNNFFVPKSSFFESKAIQEGDSSTCPYCQTEITSTDQKNICQICQTPHHTDCWNENKGCTVYGCHMAPQDEDKIIIIAVASSGEVPPVLDKNVDNIIRSCFHPFGPQVRPWVRFWARSLDYSLFAFLVLIF